MSFSTGSTSHLVRSNLWSNSLKDVLEDELMGTKYVRMLTEFGDGDTFNIPSIGQAEVRDYAEGQAVTYTGMDTGNFTFTMTDYKSSATYITEKAKQDWFYVNELTSMFVPKMHRALMVAMENDIMELGPDGQTSADSNTINGAKHRFVAGGTNDKISIVDFAKANYALDKANVPTQGRVAIVDPSVVHELATQTNLVNLSNNPTWEGIVRDQTVTGMRFVTSIYGFDVYVSNYLKSGMSETIDANSITNGVANLFFSTAGDVLPFVGAIRQMPKVDSEFNKDLQREEYVTTMRYGFKLYRPENMVVVLSDNSQVYA